MPPALPSFTTPPRSIEDIARDPAWFPHRYDPGHDALHFLPISREMHRGATFLTDEYLPNGLTPIVVLRRDAIASAPERGAIHFVFHSAFCCSTMLARAFDAPGHAMGLKEPVVLNDIVGWRRRGGQGPDMAEVLDDILILLARPFAPGEAAIVKPSNIVAGLAAPMLALRPEAKALLLYAPLRTYLGSIAKKGIDGRLWARTMILGLLDDKLAEFGFSSRDLLGQTDLQAAALGWLAQHALFATLVNQFGDTRVRTLDSETLTRNPAAVLSRLDRLFGTLLKDSDITAITTGPAFKSHSKLGTAFDIEEREDEHRNAATLHADEIEKVLVWAGAVARSIGISMIAPAPLMALSAP